MKLKKIIKERIKELEYEIKTESSRQEDSHAAEAMSDLRDELYGILAEHKANKNPKNPKETVEVNYCFHCGSDKIESNNGVTACIDCFSEFKVKEIL